MKCNVSVVIPALNEEKYLARTLDVCYKQLKRSKLKGEIIVVDNNSEDKTREIALQKADVVVLEKKRVISIARNRGAALAKAEFILFLDADTEVSSDFLSSALKEMHNKKVAAVGAFIYPKNLELRHSLLFFLLNAPIGAVGAMGKAIAAGNCLLVRKSAFKKIKGFHTAKAAGEDFDLCNRLRKAKYKVVVLPLVVYTSNRRIARLRTKGLLKEWIKTTFNYLLGLNTKKYSTYR